MLRSQLHIAHAQRVEAGYLAFDEQHVGGYVARLLERSLFEPCRRGVARTPRGCVEAFDRADERRVGAELLTG